MAERKVTFIVGANIKAFQKGMDKVSRKFERMGRNMKRVGSDLTTFVSTPLAAIGGIAVKTAADYEQLQIQMNNLVGSAEDGVKVFEDLRKFSASTPFQLRDVIKATNTMVGMGRSVEEARYEIELLGNISSATGADLGELSRIFSESAAEGRLLTRDIRQFTAQGVPAVNLLAESMGVAQGEIFDMASKSQIHFKDLRKAIEMVAGEGGRWANATADQADTIAGRFSTLKDNVVEALAAIGDSIVDAFSLKEVMEAATKRIQGLVQSFKDLSDQAKRRIVIITAAIAGIGPFLIAVGGTVAALGVTIGALTSPVTLLIGAIGGIALAFEYVRRNLDTFADYFKQTFVKIKNSVIQEASDIRDSFTWMFQGLPGFTEFNIGAKAALLSLKDPIPEVESEFQSFGQFIGSIGDDLLGKFEELSKLDLSGMIDPGGMGSVSTPSTGGGTGFSEGVGRGSDVLGAMLPSPNRLQEIASGFTRVANSAQRIPDVTKKISQASQVAMDIANQFTNSFGAGMANIIVQGKKLQDVLKNIGQLLLSSAIQKGISLLLTGGLSGGGFFGSGGGLFGRIFGVNDALITSGGDVVEFHPDDNILAMKDFSNLPMGGGSGRLKATQPVVVQVDGREVYRSVKEYEYKLGQ